MKVKGTIKEIKDRLAREEVTEAFLRELMKDSRTGVQQLARSHLKKLERKRQEMDRIDGMWEMERTYRKRGYQVIAGLDEAGRGPLAGPVVAAAVILPEDFDASGLNDSKKLSPEERFSLRERILKEAVSVGVGLVDNRYIDRHNVLQATFEAMRRAIRDLDPQPEVLLLDAVEIPGVAIHQHPVVKGDALSHSIAAASVIAKTTRDQWMIEAAGRFPEYGFDRHMGYGTPDHLAALAKWGPCPLHRRSFAPVAQLLAKEEGDRGSTG